MPNSVHDDLEAIRQMKYRYGRAVDLRDFAAIEDVLADDFTMESSPHDDLATLNTSDRAQTLITIREKFIPDLISQHHMHAPELCLTGETTAEGVWYLEYFSCNVKTRQTARGTSLYFDKYVKVSDKWKMRHMKYQLVYRIEEPLATDAMIAVHFVGWEAGWKSALP